MYEKHMKAQHSRMVSLGDIVDEIGIVKGGGGTQPVSPSADIIADDPWAYLATTPGVTRQASVSYDGGGGGGGGGGATGGGSRGMGGRGPTTPKSPVGRDRAGEKIAGWLQYRPTKDQMKEKGLLRTSITSRDDSYNRLEAGHPGL